MPARAGVVTREGVHPGAVCPREAPARSPLEQGQTVGGRLALFHPSWSKITLDPWVLNIVSEGLLLSFHSPPPMSNIPLCLTSHHPSLREVVISLRKKGAIEPVFNPDSPGFYSRLFLVPKKDGSWRPVIDLSTLNSFMRVDKFKMETPASVRLAIRTGDWAVFIDLSDAYFHVLMHPSARKFLRFLALNQVWQFRALPFGLSTAPRVFTKLMLVVGAHFRSSGIRILQYLDDWLLLHKSKLRLSDIFFSSIRRLFITLA